MKSVMVDCSVAGAIPDEVFTLLCPAITIVEVVDSHLVGANTVPVTLEDQKSEKDQVYKTQMHPPEDQINLNIHKEQADAQGKAGGLALAWNNNIHLEIVHSSINQIDAMVMDNMKNKEWVLSCFYGSPYKEFKEKSWEFLREMSEVVEDPWLVIGGLIDLGFSGHPLTWSNHRDGWGLVEERLDRSLSNTGWLDLFSKSMLKQLASIASDHSPILLTTNPSFTSGPKPFKFFGLWLEDDSCKPVISESWDLNQVGSAGHKLISQISSIIPDPTNPLYSQNLINLAVKLETWYNLEEAFWKVKAGEKDVKLGDGHTSYFHSLACNRDTFNMIDSIKDPHGLWLEDQAAIAECLTSHFKGMATSTNIIHDFSSITNLIPSCIKKGLDQIHQFGYWEIINGETVDIWKDKWIPNVTYPLVKSELESLSDINKVCSLFNVGTRDWNAEIIDLCFPSQTRNKILNLKPYLGEEDIFKWSLSMGGKFTVKSLFNTISTSTAIVNSSIWNKHWSFDILPRIIMFIWKCLYDILPLNGEYRGTRCIPARCMNEDEGYSFAANSALKWCVEMQLSNFLIESNNKQFFCLSAGSNTNPVWSSKSHLKKQRLWL
ncbi:hypothetical protein BVC80_1463g3 [Macleaya cordata]|uniref:Reverse transcriptase zinc-binding domain n=1 Tax=Macleaya cordata TaxID=56857 RepID=A0A200QMD7_MACCD|nr:hypothetical protein BVC80_1463g3 [Macleaya cordata]